MTLSNKAINLLADTLAPKVAEVLLSSDAFIEFIHSEIPAIVDTEVGEMDDDLLFDLSLAVMERITLRAV